MNKTCKKIKQGVTLYVVWVYYPYVDSRYETQSRECCKVEMVRCMSRVSIDDKGTYSFYGVTNDPLQSLYLRSGLQKYISGVLCGLYYPQDMGLVNEIGHKQYHKAFFSKKKAERYVDQVKSGCII